MSPPTTYLRLRQHHVVAVLRPIYPVLPFPVTHPPLLCPMRGIGPGDAPKNSFQCTASVCNVVQMDRMEMERQPVTLQWPERLFYSAC